MKDKNHMIISVDVKKIAFDKIQHLLMIKILNKIGIERTYLSIIKTIYEKLTANIKLNGEKLKAFPLRDQEQDKDAHSHCFHSTLEALAIAIRQGKEKNHPNRNRRNKNCHYLQMT